MANKPQIETKFILQGLGDALQALKSFAKSAEASLEGLNKTTSSLNASFVGIAEASKAAAVTIRESLDSVKESTGAVKENLASTKTAFGGIAAGAKAAASAAAKSMGLISGESKRTAGAIRPINVSLLGVGKSAVSASKRSVIAVEGLRLSLKALMGTLGLTGSVGLASLSLIGKGAREASKGVRSAFSKLPGLGGLARGGGDLTKASLEHSLGGAIGSLTGTGIGIKLRLSPSTITGILGSFRDIAARAAGILRPALRFLNPLSRSGVFGLARRVVRAGRFAALPAAGEVGVAYEGAQAINKSVEEQVTTGAGAGIPGQQYSKIDSVFRQVGGSGADAVEVIGKFNEAIEDVAKNGSASKFASVFQQAGVEVQNFDGTFKTGYQLFDEYWKKFSDVPSGGTTLDQLDAIKGSLHTIVGNSKALIPLDHVFGRSAEEGGLDSLVNNVDKFGTAIGPQQISAMNKFSEGLGSVKEAFRGVAITLATVVGPGLGTWLSAIANMIGDNRDTIVEHMRSFIATLVTFSSEVILVITGMDKAVQEGTIGEGGSGEDGYAFRFHWLITVRDWAVAAWGVFKTFFSYLQVAGGAAFVGIENIGEKLAPLGDKIAVGLGKAVTWLGQFVLAMGQLASTGETTPQFAWVPKLAGLLEDAYGVVVKFLGKAFELRHEVLENPASKGLADWIIEKFFEASRYVIALTANVRAFATGHQLEEGFQWIEPVGTGLMLLGGWLKDAGVQFLSFVSAIGGNADALAANPGIAKFKASLSDDLWPRIKAFVANAVDFLQAVMPPVFSTIAAIFETLKPYVDGLGSTLKNAGEYVVQIFEAAAQFFSGKQIKPDMAWVGTVLTDIGQLVNSFIDLGHYVAGAFSALAGNNMDPKFEWIRRAKEWVLDLKTVMLDVGDFLAHVFNSFGTGWTPVQASLATFFGLFALSKMGGVLSVLKLLVGGFTEFGRAVSGAAVAGKNFVTPSLTRTIVGGGAGVAGEVAGAGGALAATKVARGASGAVVAAEEGAGLLGPMLSVLRWAGWAGLVITLDLILDHFTGINGKIVNFLNNFLSGNPGGPAQPGLDRQRAALDDLARQDAAANSNFQTGADKLQDGMAFAKANPHTGLRGPNGDLAPVDPFSIPLNFNDQTPESDISKANRAGRSWDATPDAVTLRAETPAERFNRTNTDNFTAPADRVGGAGSQSAFTLNIGGTDVIVQTATAIANKVVAAAQRATNRSDRVSDSSDLIPQPLLPSSAQ
jgi:hypothetical protein